MEFKNNEQLKQVADEWIKVLRLTNWIITVELNDGDDMEEGDAGDILITPHKKIGQIRISTKIIKDKALKICKEKTVVHELLHCYINTYEKEENIEYKSYCDNEHATLDIIARALIIEKYNLPYNWFEIQ